MSKTRDIPQTLVYEMIDGTPVYYRGYQEVLAGSKKIEEIMGSSVLQGRIIAELIMWMAMFLDRERYQVITSEVGIHFAKNSWRNLDLAIVDKSRMAAELNSTQYLKTPPKVVIEVDIKAHFEDTNHPLTYWEPKVEQLLNYGVEKVIWIFTDTKRVLIAEKGKDWILANWDRELEVLEGQTLNLSKLINQS